MSSHACDVTGVNSTPFKVWWAQQEMRLTHSPHTDTHSVRYQPPSPQSCHANHLNSTIKANTMFHVGRKKTGKVIISVCECDRTEGDFDFEIFSS